MNNTTLAYEAVKVGDKLPPLSIDITTGLIIGACLGHP